MITEDYVSFETAKLLKEKGFDGILPCVYIDTKSDKKPCLLDTLCNYNDGHIKDVISAPTLQMAMKWLRKEYNIHISIQPDFPSDKDYKLCWCWSVNILHENCISMKGYQYNIETNEEAADAAIRYCLENLI